MNWMALILAGVGCDAEDPELAPTTLAERTEPTAPTVPKPDPTDPTTPFDTGTPITTPGTVADCAEGETYPEGAVEPMAFGEVLSPYTWPVAIEHTTGASLDLDLALVPCALDPDIDWSPFDVLLFVSIPAW